MALPIFQSVYFTDEGLLPLVERVYLIV
jgi:hypothetical protein